MISFCYWKFYIILKKYHFFMEVYSWIWVLDDDDDDDDDDDIYDWSQVSKTFWFIIS
jgi:hypothetical protein